MSSLDYYYGRRHDKKWMAKRAAYCRAWRAKQKAAGVVYWTPAKQLIAPEIAELRRLKASPHSPPSTGK